MPQVKEPRLGAPFDRGLRTLAQSLDETMFALTGQRDPRAASVLWAAPSEVMALCVDLANKVSDEAIAYRNGTRVRDGSEPGIAWRGSSARDDSSMIARFGGGDPEREALVRTAMDAFDRLSASGAFGMVRPSREAYVRAALTGAVGVTYRGGAR